MGTTWTIRQPCRSKTTSGSKRYFVRLTRWLAPVEGESDHLSYAVRSLTRNKLEILPEMASRKVSTFTPDSLGEWRTRLQLANNITFYMD